MSSEVTLSSGQLVDETGAPLNPAALVGPRLGDNATADTPGTVVASIEAFDADGNPLGFLAVYDEITVA